MLNWAAESLQPGGAGGAAAAQAAPTAGGTRIEVGFSPEGSAEQLVEKAINSARSSIRLAAYSFTSPAVVQALIAAKRRGVDVAVVVDEKNNLQEDRRAGAAALNLLVNAGIPTRTISVYPIHHDKYFVVDGLDVETGSFNYSQAAARRNSENAIVIWHDPALAKAYLDHWQSRWAQGVDYRSAY
ncbi:endonuclease [Burkholderia ubonensis]|nr:endonuclease [Burkholderia ubonensis]